MSKTFLTFANTDYMSNERILNQAKELNVFDKIIGSTEYDISEFIQKHKTFITQNKFPGYGMWIWKPKIILDNLLKLQDNDILLYCDSGIYLNNNGIERLQEYFNILNNKNINMITFATSEKYKAQNFVKNDAIMSYYPEFNNRSDIACYAGLMICKKNNNTLNLIEDWLNLCENYHFLDRSPSCTHSDLPHYDGNDCDNGLFNLCLAKHSISHAIYPDETNIYDSNNMQIVHVLSKNDYLNIDWSSLNKYPFQNRRITPKFYTFSH